MRNSLNWIGYTALLLTAVPSVAQAPAQCDQADLQTMVDGYLAAQASGDPLKLPLANFTRYTEQGEDGSMSTGLLSKPQKIGFQRTFFDLASCATFSEVIVSDPTHAYVIGTRLQFAGRDNPIAPSRVNEIESVIADKDSWLFDATRTLQFSKQEDWTEIPLGDRDTRIALLAAANAYLDWNHDKSVKVPWATPCARLEGGSYTGKEGGTGAGAERCDVSPASNAKLTDRRYVVDVPHGAVAVLLSFGSENIADTHIFRIEHGKIRYIHVTRACKTATCGVPSSAEVKQRIIN